MLSGKKAVTTQFGLSTTSLTFGADHVAVPH
jgi:hypothetical protein